MMVVVVMIVAVAVTVGVTVEVMYRVWLRSHQSDGQGWLGRSREVVLASAVGSRSRDNWAGRHLS